MVDLKNENAKLSDKYNKSNSIIKNLTTEIKDCKEKLKLSEDNLEKVTVRILVFNIGAIFITFYFQTFSKLYQSTLIVIKDKIDPVLRIINKDTSNSNDKDDKKHEETKSRWEKDTKSNIKEESIDDLLKVADIYKIEEETN